MAKKDYHKAPSTHLRPSGPRYQRWLAAAQKKGLNSVREWLYWLADDAAEKTEKVALEAPRRYVERD